MKIGCLGYDQWVGIDGVSSQVASQITDVFGKNHYFVAKTEKRFALNRLWTLHDLNPVLKNRVGPICVWGVSFFWVVPFSFPGKTVGNELKKTQIQHKGDLDRFGLLLLEVKDSKQVTTISQRICWLHGLPPTKTNEDLSLITSHSQNKSPPFPWDSLGVFLFGFESIWQNLTWIFAAWKNGTRLEDESFPQKGQMHAQLGRC